jgi:flotillin
MIIIAALITVATIIGIGLFLAVIWRRVVPTNMVHIVQSSKKTVSYGRGREAGNTYYAIPSFIPFFGVTVTLFPESVFDLNLRDYDAYDVDRLPFLVDVRAFFRISDSQIAAQRVSNFAELQGQLGGVLQGAVRSVLAQYSLDHIMSDRATLGRQFSDVVDLGLKEWGVSTVKTIEFMDIRDSRDSQVIHNIMAKKKSYIEMESRVEVAKNMQDAETKEIEAKRQIALSRTEAEQQVGIRQAEKEKTIGIAQEKNKQEVQLEAKLTTERQMEVQKVQSVRQAEIDKEVATVKAEQDKQVQVVNAEAAKQAQITNAEAEKESVTQIAEGKLAATLKNAEGIQAEGTARAEAEKALLLAPVNAQITLANEIGSNEGYQAYLIKVRNIEATEAVGKEMAGAIKAADLKIIANSGDVQSGIGNLADVFTPKGGTSIAGMLAALNQTEEGSALLGKVVGAVTDAAKTK